MIRPKCVSNFTQIPNQLIRCKSLSSTARMLLIAAISTPDGWKFSEEGMQTAFGFKRSEVRKAVKELSDAKILKREYTSKEGNLLRGLEWRFDFSFISEHNGDISEVPSGQPFFGKPKIGKPKIGKPSYGEPHVGKPKSGDYTIQREQDIIVNTDKSNTITTNKQSVVNAPTQEQLEELYREFGEDQECVAKMREIATVCKQTNWLGIGHPIDYIRGVGEKVRTEWNGFVARCDASERMRREPASA